MSIIGNQAAWNSSLMAAMNELGESNNYMSRLTVEQLKTEDKEKWSPPERIREHVVNCDDIDIQMIDSSIKLTDVDCHLRQCGRVGLVLMGPNIGRYSRPLLIILTTECKYFIINPGDINHGIQFLKNQLENQDSGVTFWTTNSLKEAECLYHNYGIRLLNSQARCCIGLHLGLMRVLKYIPNRHLSNFRHIWPTEALQASRWPPKIEPFERLVQIYLTVDRKDIQYDAAQYIHLNSRPLNLTAKNLIMKRCILVSRLAECLDFYSTTEFRRMNYNVLKCFRGINDKDLIRRLENIMIKRQKDKCSQGVGRTTSIEPASPIYYEHLLQVDEDD